MEEKTKIADTVLKVISEGTTVIYIAKAFDDYAATYITPSIEKQFGYTPDEFLSHPEFWVNHIHPDDRVRVLEGLTPLFENSHHNHEYRFQHKDGSYRWMHDELTLLRNDDGSPLQIIGHWIDVTERKNRELDANNALSQLNATLKATTDGILVVDNTGKIQACNQMFIDLWRIPKDVIAQNSDEAALTFVLSQLKNSEDFISKVESLYNTPNAESFDTLDFKDGRIFERYSRPQKIDNQIIGRVWSFRDVTKKIKVKRLLIESKEKAETASKAKSQFLSTMSHELRTPLNAIMGYGELLAIRNADGEITNEIIQKYTTYIIKGGHQLIGLINEVLDLSRIESRHLDIVLESVLLTEVVTECIDQIKVALAGKYNVTLNENAFEKVYVLADKDRVRQVIINLLSNAVKYNREGGTVTVTVMTELVDEDRLRILINDTGVGITSEDMGKLFDPFERLTFKHGQIEGSGIGLTVTKQLVEAMGGIIGVESTINKGSTFWVELPIATHIDESMNAISTALPESHSIKHKNETKHTVLYIEDNPMNVQLMEDVLNNKGNFDLLTSLTAEDGLTIAEEKIPDIILMDINLPGIDGITALKILRSVETTKKIPVIAVSGAAMDNDTKTGQAAGFDDYLTKPYDLGRLSAVIEKQLTDSSTS